MIYFRNEKRVKKQRVKSSIKEEFFLLLKNEKKFVIGTEKNEREKREAHGMVQKALRRSTRFNDNI